MKYIPPKIMDFVIESSSPSGYENDGIHGFGIILTELIVEI
jgi:hypothetical protein